MAKLTRAGRPGNTLDSRGPVEIKIIRLAPGTRGALKGNIVRSFTVAEATVSEVAELVEEKCLAKPRKAAT